MTSYGVTACCVFRVPYFRFIAFTYGHKDEAKGVEEKRKQRCFEIYLKEKTGEDNGVDWPHFCLGTVFNYLSLWLGHHIN